jgi:hypothetical protein
MRLLRFLISLFLGILLAYAGYYKSDWIFYACWVLSGLYFLNAGMQMSGPDR